MAQLALLNVIDLEISIQLVTGSVDLKMASMFNANQEQHQDFAPQEGELVAIVIHINCTVTPQ